jgi:hypothetical protein
VHRHKRRTRMSVTMFACGTWFLCGIAGTSTGREASAAARSFSAVRMSERASRCTARAAGCLRRSSTRGRINDAALAAASATGRSNCDRRHHGERCWCGVPTSSACSTPTRTGADNDYRTKPRPPAHALTRSHADENGGRPASALTRDGRTGPGLVKPRHFVQRPCPEAATESTNPPATRAKNGGPVETGPVRVCVET